MPSSSTAPYGTRAAATSLRACVEASIWYYGYWWLKRYQSEFTLPPECLEGASEARLRLLGYKMPDRDLHIYNPDLPF